MVKLLTSLSDTLADQVVALHAATTLKVATKWTRDRNFHRIETEWKDIDATDPKFKRIKAERVAEVEYRLGCVERELETFNKVVKAWHKGMTGAEAAMVKR